MGSSVQNDKWTGLAEIADYIGVSKDTIRNWIKNSNMPAHKVGRLWKFKKSEVDQWIATKNNNARNWL
jgi:excisionase family DNA binding protein